MKEKCLNKYLIYKLRSITKINKQGFTLIEIIISLGLIVIIAAISIPLYNNWLPNASVEQSAIQFENLYALARSRSENRIDNMRYGVYLDIVDGRADRIIVYEGNSFEARQSANDQIENLPNGIDISSTLSNNDINFSAVDGRPSAVGEVTFQSATSKKSLVVTINDWGLLN